MIKIKQKGDFSRFKRYTERVLEILKLGKLDKYGREGVAALSAATPVRTGKTAASWSYKITHSFGSVSITFSNSNVVDGTSIAIILQYGHGTKNGGWVQGRDYINPAIQPILDAIADNAWKEIKSL